jgi:acyl dehydratase
LRHRCTLLSDPELRAELLRVLHTAQEMEFLAPIQPGDRIFPEARIAEIASVRGGESLTLDLRASNQRDQIVSRIRFTVLIQGRRERAAAAEPNVSNDQAARGAPVCAVTERVAHDQTLRYAEASGDRNPIHVDDNFAKLAGLPGSIVHGLCAMAFAARALTDKLCDGDPLRLEQLAARFARPIFPGDSLTTSLWFGDECGGHRRVSFETANAAGVIVMRDGRAEIRSP